MTNSKRAATFHPDDGPDAAAANRAELARLDGEGNPVRRKGGNSESTSDVRAGMCAELVEQINRAALLPEPERTEQ